MRSLPGRCNGGVDAVVGVSAQGVPALADTSETPTLTWVAIAIVGSKTPPAHASRGSTPRGPQHGRN